MSAAKLEKAPKAAKAPKVEASSPAEKTAKVAKPAKVKKAKVVDAEGAQPNAVECCENAAKKTTFSKFCGDDANIRWTYSVE